MITIISSLVMFLCLVTGALVHLINSQSKSYLLIIGYLSGALILCIRIEQSRAFIDFGVWVIPFALIALGEVLRFHKRERFFSDKLDTLVRKEGIHIPFQHFQGFQPGLKMPLLNAKSAVLQYKSPHSAILHTELTEPLSFIPDDFNMHLKSIDGTTKIYYKGLVHVLTSTGINISAGTPVQIVPTDVSKLELTLRDRIML